MSSYKAKHLFENGSHSLCESFSFFPFLLHKHILLGSKRNSVRKQNLAVIYQSAILPAITHHVLWSPKKTRARTRARTRTMSPITFHANTQGTKSTASAPKTYLQGCTGTETYQQSRTGPILWRAIGHAALKITHFYLSFKCPWMYRTSSSCIN